MFGGDTLFFFYPYYGVENISLVALATSHPLNSTDHAFGNYSLTRALTRRGRFVISIFSNFSLGAPFNCSQSIDVDALGPEVLL